MPVYMSLWFNKSVGFFEKKKKKSDFISINVKKYIYFSLAKIFVLRLFKMVPNQIDSSRLEYLVAVNCKPDENYWILCDVYRKQVLVQ